MIETALRMWPVTVPIAVLGGVGLAFTRCAVAHIAVALAARLYTNHAGTQRSKCDEWLQILGEMKASERPAHAGTLLWAGCIRFIRRSCRYGPMERFTYARAVVAFCQAAEQWNSQGPLSRKELRGEFRRAFRKHSHDLPFIAAMTELAREMAVVIDQSVRCGTGVVAEVRGRVVAN